MPTGETVIDPVGNYYGTDGDDTVILTYEGRRNSVSVAGGEGNDTLVIDHSNSGSIDGSIVYFGDAGNRRSYVQIRGERTYIDGGFENLRVTGTDGRDYHEFEVFDDMSGRTYDYVGGDGPDTLVADFSAVTGAIDFNGSAGDLVLPYGTFVSYEHLRVYGGPGDDRIESGIGADRLYGGDGSDVLIGGNGSDRLEGGSGANVLSGQRGDDTVYSISLDDRAFGGSGDDYFIGNYQFETQALDISLGTSLTIGGSEVAINFERYTLYLSSTNDTVSVTGADITRANFFGGGGHDFALVDADQRDDALYFFVERNPSVHDDLAADGGYRSREAPFGGSATFDDFERFEFTGGSANDWFILDPGGATLDVSFDGGAGDDWLQADLTSLRFGTTLVVETDGSIISNFGTFISIERFDIEGSDFDDYYSTTVGADTISTGRGNDTVFAGAGDDRIFGGNGDDRLYGGDGNDEIDGGIGADYIVGNAGDDTLNGGYENDRMAGGAGNDRMEGSFGEDTVYGGSGNDYIDGGSNNDFLGGNDGDDVIYGRSGADNIRGGRGNDVIDGNNDDDRIYGEEGADRISGGSGNDYILAGSENDLVNGGWGDDFIRGQDGDDNLFGSLGDDSIGGGAGNDRIQGGLGNDILAGNSGFDNFVFDEAIGSDNVDFITDFVVGEDTIELDLGIFTAITGGGTLSADQFRAGTSATTADQRIIFTRSTGELFYDADGSGAGEQILIARLDPNLAIFAEDFTLASAQEPIAVGEKLPDMLMADASLV